MKKQHIIDPGENKFRRSPPAFNPLKKEEITLAATGHLERMGPFQIEQKANQQGEYQVLCISSGNLALPDSKGLYPVGMYLIIAKDEPVFLTLKYPTVEKKY